MEAASRFQRMLHTVWGPWQRLVTEAEAWQRTPTKAILNTDIEVKSPQILLMRTMPTEAMGLVQLQECRPRELPIFKGSLQELQS